MSANSSVTWTTGPSGNTAGAHIAAAPYSMAGMACSLSPNQTLFDLSGFDTLEFDGIVPAGTQVNVGFGRIVDNVWYGCAWYVSGNDVATYSLDLNKPDWCGPTECSYDMQASVVQFSALWGGANGTTADVEVSRVQFFTKKSGVGTTSFPGSGYGPGGACWFTDTWGSGSSEWYAPLSLQAAKVRVIAPDDDGASGGGADVEFGDVDIRGKMVAITASVPSGQGFSAGLSDNTTQPGPTGCWWNLVGKGAGTYTFDPTLPDGCQGPTSLNLRHIHSANVHACCGSTVDIEVNSFDLVAP